MPKGKDSPSNNLAPKPRGAGRPPGAKNKLKVKDELERAIKSGMTFTEVKEHLSDLIKNPLPEMSPSAYLTLMGTYINLSFKLLERYDAQKEETNDNDTETGDKGGLENIVPFSMNMNIK